MEYLKMAYFTTQILQQFQNKKKGLRAKLIQCSNQDNIDCADSGTLDSSDVVEIANLYSELLLQTHLESQFLEFVNCYPEKITDNDINNWDSFYNQFREWRLK